MSNSFFVLTRASLIFVKSLPYVLSIYLLSVERTKTLKALYLFFKSFKIEADSEEESPILLRDFSILGSRNSSGLAVLSFLIISLDKAF